MSLMFDEASDINVHGNLNVFINIRDPKGKSRGRKKKRRKRKENLCTVYNQAFAYGWTFGHLSDWPNDLTFNRGGFDW